MRQTFTKSERLCSKKILGELFKKGSTLVQTYYLFPFRVLYLPTDPTRAEALPALVITVPKRTFKRAVDRNRIRRLVREAYRRNKSLLPVSHSPAYVAFLYTAKRIISFEEIEKGMKLALRRMADGSVSAAPSNSALNS